MWCCDCWGRPVRCSYLEPEGPQPVPVVPRMQVTPGRRTSGGRRRSSMRRIGSPMSRAWIGVLGLLAAVDAGAEVLTADRAVQLALAHNLDVIRADATVLDAKAGVYSAWSSILPTFSLNLTKSDQRVTNETGFTQVAGNVVPILPNDSHHKSTIPSLSASWLGLRFSSWSNYSSAQGSLTAANRSLDAAKSEAALQARRGFYEVVKAVKLEGVAGGSLKLARDDERRVRALFEVGSVSRSDLLKAQVRTSQSELDSIVANHTVTARRNDLAILDRKS